MEEQVYFKVEQVLEEADSKALVKCQQNYKTLLLSYALICLIFVSFNLRHVDDSVFMGIGSIVFVVIMLLLALRFPARAAKLSMKKARLVTGSAVITDEITFCEQYFYENVPNRSTRYTYQQIVKVKETKQHYFLMLSANLGIIVKKSAFTYGDSGTFAAFLDERRRIK